MSVNSSRFKEYCRDGGAPYFQTHAIDCYLFKHMSEAFDLCDQICDDIGEPRLLSWDDCWEIIGKMTPEDAFTCGRISNALAKGGYHTFEGGRFCNITSSWEYMKRTFHFASKGIVNGRYEISDGLRAAIDAARESDVENCNARPKVGYGKPAPKSSKNAPPKAGAKAPAKKTSNRAPARRHRL